MPYENLIPLLPVACFAIVFSIGHEWAIRIERRERATVRNQNQRVK